MDFYSTNTGLALPFES